MMRQPRTWVIGAVLVVLVGIAATLIVTSGDDETASPAKATTTTSSASSTTTSTTEPDLDTATAVWPVASGTVRYSDPVAATNGFATDYLGFTDPFVGAFRQGDSRSGEVDVRPFADGPVTTIFVRRLGADGTWWVLGAATGNISVSEPAALASITSPVSLAGTSTAFEATVAVRVRADGNDEPIGSGTVMGGSNGNFGPFRSTLTFGTPTAAYGAVVFFTVSAQDGSILEAAVVRVHFS